MTTINPNDKQSNNRTIQEKSKETQTSPVRRKSVSFAIPDSPRSDKGTLKSKTSLKSKADKTEKGYDNLTIVLSATTNVKLRKAKEKLFHYKIMAKIFIEHTNSKQKAQFKPFGDTVNSDLDYCIKKFDELQKGGFTDKNALQSIQNLVKKIVNNLDKPYQKMQSVILKDDKLLNIYEEYIQSVTKASSRKRKIPADSSLEHNKRQTTMHDAKIQDDEDKKPAAKKSPPSK